MPPPILTLTTDFGLSDHYVGVMKGVILERCPNATIVDISHTVPPFALLSGAYTIDQAARYFPAGTIHVVVIDPGVGTARRPLLAEAGGSYYIAPDNGVLSMVLAHSKETQCRVIQSRQFWLPETSATFHGRDIFAPTAAALAAGAVTADAIGPRIADPKLLPDLDPVPDTANSWRGTVLNTDHFGNVITNFSGDQFAHRLTGAFELVLGAYRINTLYRTFGESESRQPFAYWGSSGYLEVGINLGRAADLLGAEPGQKLRLAIS